MKINYFNEFIEFLTSLFVNYPEGMFLYTGGVLTVTVINIVYKKVWDEGSIGSNKLWDMPEQMFVIYVRWVIPNMLIAAYCLPKVVSVTDALLVFASGFALYALTGRWGLEWLGTMRSGGSIKSTTEESTKVEITKETTNQTSQSSQS